MRKGIEPPALTWVNLDARVRILPAAVPATATSEPKIRPRRFPDPSVTDAPSVDEVPATAASASTPDWRAAIEGAATEAVARIVRDGHYRPLGRVEPAQADSSPASSVFYTPTRQAGDIDHDAVQGSTLVWHNEHCYTEIRFPTIKDPNALVGAPNPPKCMRPIGERTPRGDLFETIKPP